MHNADKQRTQSMKEAEPGERAAQPRRRAQAIAVVLLDSRVGVPVKMQPVAVLVDVGVRSRHARVAGRELFAEPFHRSGEIENAEQNEHQAYGEFHGQARAGRYHYAEEDDGASDNGNGERVTAAPEDADQARFEDGTLAADDGGNGNDVIGIGGVTHPEKKTDEKNGESARQWHTPNDLKAASSSQQHT